MKYKTVIGLEIHAELNTKSKMFCSCANDPNEKRPNFNVCPICMGHPGTLPVINWEAVRKVIKTGIALNCQIPSYSKFDRKNYFYPDLPKGYQISQYDKPLCIEGYLEIDGLPAGRQGKKIRVRRVHLEEDTGSLQHDKGTDYSLVNLNRAGVPLMELVTEPDIETGEQARKFAEELQLILRYLGVSEANMEKGEMRVEVNLSLSNPSADRGRLGTKVEIKNLNSFRAVQGAIDYEIERQAEMLDKGEKIVQETRGWDDVKNKTISQREKEEAHDYRYFSEPDLPDLHFTEEDIQDIQAEISELPNDRRKRYEKEYGLDSKIIEVFTQDKNFGNYFEKVVCELNPNLEPDKLVKLIKLTVNYLLTDLQGLLKSRRRAAGMLGPDEAGAAKNKIEGIDNNFSITPENFAEFVSLIADDKISSKVAKQVLEEMLQKGKDPSQIVEDNGLMQISDTAGIEKAIQEAINDPKNQKAIRDFKSGKESAIQFIVGQIMAQTKGKAKPQMVREILISALTIK